MKKIFLIIILLIVCILNANGQTYSSKNNHTDYWTNKSAWLTNVVPVDGSNTTINIFGWITDLTALSFTNNLVINVYDTLILDGSFTLKNNTNINVESNGILIVKNAFQSKNNLNLNIKTGGVAIFGGTFDAGGGGTNINNLGDLYIFNNTPIPANKIPANTKKENQLPTNLKTLYYGASVPVILKYFDAVIVGTTFVNFTWETSLEMNNNYFVLQRSRDGAHWDSIGTIYAEHKNTEISQYYHYQDRLILNRTVLYRLKQVDVNGVSKIFNIIGVNGPKISQMTVYPNPASTKITVIGGDFELLSEKNSVVANGVDGETLIIEGLPRGIYYIKMGDEIKRIVLIRE